MAGRPRRLAVRPSLEGQPSLTFAFDFLNKTKQIAAGLQTTPTFPARIPKQK